MPVTADRADVIHFAGRHRLSPAVRAGGPALVPQGETRDRCGWATFFTAMRARGLAASFDPADGASLSFVPRAGASDHPRGEPGGGPGAFSEARRFLEALRGRPPPPA